MPRRFSLVLAAALLAAASAPSPAAAQRQIDCAGCTFGIQVTADVTAETWEGNTVQTASFTVLNTGSATQSATFTCSTTGGVTCLSITPASLLLAGGVDGFVDVTYNVGSGGTLTLTGTLGSATDTGVVTITATAGTAPTVTLVVPTLSTGIRAVVHNRQPVIRALITGGSTVDTTQTQLKWRGGSVTSLTRLNRRLVEWEVDSTRWLAVGDSALIEVRACSYGGACSTWVSRWAVLLNDQLPVLGFTGQPFEALGAGFSASFGPGLSVSGAEVETGFGTVPYVSRDQPRSTGLVYSTRQSYPRALVPVDLELPWPAGTPDQVKLVLIDGAVRMDSLVLATPSCATGAVKRCRAVLQGDFSGATPGSTTRKWLKIEVSVTSGAMVKTTADSTEVVLVDRRNSPYGSGWWPTAGAQLVTAGSDRVLVAPNGAATVYRGNGDSLYLSPPGNFTLLRKAGSGWELSTRGDRGKLVFDSQGRLVQSVDRNGQTENVYYNATTPTQIDSLKDPGGFRISLSYSGGKLTTITSLTGGAARQTTISINGSNQLVYDSLSSVPARAARTTYVYQTYPGTNTSVLSKRIGVILDTTIVTYDSTFRRRPVQVRLPGVQDELNNPANPVISYVAYERQGYGALRSLDSVYVEMKDPRNNWTRSLLNRWGQARKSWDVLATLSRAQYAADGLVEWSEGKVADSSRTYYAYDGLRRLTKSYIIRAVGDTLRGDSLVYNANSWVVNRIDNRGKNWQAIFDANGNLLRSITPTGDTTVYQYTPYGQLFSRKLPDQAAKEVMIYDGVWLNLAKVVGTYGDTTVRKTYDSYGREIASESRIVSKKAGATTYYQWRKRETFYNIGNQADSTRLRRGDDCAPCITPTYGAFDDAHIQRLSYRYDRASRDSLRVDGDTVKTQYLYDRLGRLRARRPWSDSTAVVDSMFYDVAGNLKKIRNRRGVVSTTDFDSRNRDTLTTIPGVGDLRRQYSGPLDQLTRNWVANAVDSIGGVSGEVRMGYDQRGRLKADTSYTGSIARVTQYSYDSFERPVTMADPLGTWTTRYETNRGFVDTLITPFADTVLYTYDNRGRAIGPTIRSGAGNPVQAVTPVWLQNGVLNQLTAVGGASWVRQGPTTEPGPSPLPAWYDLSLNKWQDTVSYDGWERPTTIATVKNPDDGPAVVRRDSLRFDRSGNIFTVGISGTSETYDTVTDRLQSRRAAGHYYRYSYDRSGNIIAALDSTIGTATKHNWVYGYDGLDQLRSVKYDGTVIARYGYDVLGRRIAKRVYAATTGGTVGYLRFVYHGGQVAFETDSGGTVGMKYTWGLRTDDLLAIRDGAGNHYYAVTDRVGSVRGVVQRNGTAVMSLSYSAYGLLLDSTGTGVSLRYRWTGREYDAETGFYFLRARYYDISTRRFTQEDPAGFGGGSNLYAYADGQVMTNRDPSGMTTADGYQADEEARYSSYAASLPKLGGGGGLEVYVDGVPIGAGSSGFGSIEWWNLPTGPWSPGRADPVENRAEAAPSGDDTPNWEFIDEGLINLPDTYKGKQWLLVPGQWQYQDGTADVAIGWFTYQLAKVPGRVNEKGEQYYEGVFIDHTLSDRGYTEGYYLAHGWVNGKTGQSYFYQVDFGSFSGGS